MGYFLLGALLVAVIYGAGGAGVAITLVGAAVGALIARINTLEDKLRAQRGEAPEVPSWPPQPDRSEQQAYPSPAPLTPARPVPVHAAPPPPLPSHKPDAETASVPPPLAQAASFKARESEAEEADQTRPAPIPARAQYVASEPQIQAAPWQEPAPAASRPAYSAASSTRQPDMPNLPDWAKSLLSLENWPIKLGMLLLLVGLASGYRSAGAD